MPELANVVYPYELVEFAHQNMQDVLSEDGNEVSWNDCCKITDYLVADSTYVKIERSELHDEDYHRLENNPKTRKVLQAFVNHHGINSFILINDF